MASMHVDEIKAMARRAHGDKKEMDGLFETLFGGNRDAAVNAAWALTHLPKTDNDVITERREPLVAMAITTGDISLRRITLALLERLDWAMPTEDDVPRYYVDLLDFSMEHLMMPAEPYGVRSLCMKLAYALSLPYPELLEELRRSLLTIEPSDLGKGVDHTRNKILQMLQSAIRNQ